MTDTGTIHLLKHHHGMISRCFTLALASAVAIHLTGCDREASVPEPQDSETEVVVPVSTISPEPGMTEAPPPAAAAEPVQTEPARLGVDEGALRERRDPDRVLRFYAGAIARRDWQAAAKAWGKGSGVTAATLKAAYDRPNPPVLQVGTGQQEGGAGSLYYEAPVVLRFGPGDPPQRGTLVLRRVNDVDGATAEQLRWHIERSTIGAGA